MNTVCHTSRVKETLCGGRLYSAIHTSALDNGSVIFLGALKEGETEIYEAVVPTTALIATEQPMLVMTPEIMYDQSKKAMNALGNFVNKANKAFPVVPLSAFDEIEISKEGFTGETPTVGKYVVLKNSSTKWDVVNDKPESGNVLYGKITSSRKSSLPTFLGGDGKLFPQAYDLFTITFVRQ